VIVLQRHQRGWGDAEVQADHFLEVIVEAADQGLARHPAPGRHALHGEFAAHGLEEIGLFARVVADDERVGPALLGGGLRVPPRRRTPAAPPAPPPPPPSSRGAAGSRPGPQGGGPSGSCRFWRSASCRSRCTVRRACSAVAIFSALILPLRSLSE